VVTPIQTLLTWFGQLSDKLIALGYPGMFWALVIEGVGIPFPGDAALTFYGFAAAEGRFKLFLVIPICSAGYVAGTCLAYTISRSLGRSFVDTLSRWHLFRSDGLRRTTELLDNYAAALLILGRFLPGLRSLSAYVAGVGKMAFPTFLLYTIFGSLLWCSTWILLGYWLGDNIQTFMREAQKILMYAAILAVCIGLPIWLHHRRKASRA